MRSSYQTVLLLSFAMMAFTSCNDETPEPVVSYTVPSIYAFQNVDYSGQTERLNQLDEMMVIVESAIAAKSQINGQALKDMFENVDGNGGGNYSFSSTKQLADKCFGPDVQKFEGYFEKIEAISANQTIAANGVAGYSELEGSVRLYDENGVELSELIEKGLMGAVFYYQATAVYLGDGKMNVDNETVVEGKGTDMQHHWDEAYGYLGVSQEFPANTEGLRYWGTYCNRRDDLLGSNEALSEALRRGRAAINAGVLEDRDVAIADVRKNWELVAAATVIHYLNEAIDKLGNDHVRNHVLSEAYAFLEAMFYNPEKAITNTELNEVFVKIGSNFYEVNAQDLQSARDQLSTIYNLDNVKSAL